MDVIDRKNYLELCNEIIKDMEADMERFDGQPFTGKVVGTQFGNQAAAIVALATMVRALIR